jgi:uncharacterized protein
LAFNGRLLACRSGICFYFIPSTHTMSHTRLLFIPLLVGTLLGPALAQEKPQMDLPRAKLSAGMHLIDAQVAQTPEQRQTGLMYRREMPPQEGMLFVFEQPATQCFWMKNTPLPLTAAFVADDGRIVNLADMKPHTTDSHCSIEPVRYVLEMNQGWFAKRGVQAGTRLGGFAPRQ